ncbi:DUF3515 domain-containing protein [Streptomyces sp. NPDC026092]|uniref:DUF3515 domain-containing protein n=1 Tax=Streptomyces sp. NPDC026092 TaxID=3154797 RepID=UPI0033F9307C
MTSYPRPFGLPVAAASLLVLLTAAGCSSTDAEASVPVPSPPAGEAALCQALAKELPDTVAGLDRSDPEPDSELTAGWGDGAIVLRCGVPRPEKMSDPQSQGLAVGDVRWMLERTEGGGPRFTSVYRETYIEVTLDERYEHDAAPLLDLAAPVEKTVPCALEPQCGAEGL